MGGLRVLLAVAGTAILTLGAPLVPAHAASSQQQVAGPLQVQQSAAATCNGIIVRAFGYYGCMKSGTVPSVCPWPEEFVIAPSGSIWHVWNGHDWTEMPHNGNADYMWNCYYNGNGQRQIEVGVYTSGGNGHDIYYSYYSGGWRGWYYYPGT